MSAATRKILILVVEDSESDWVLIRRAFEDSKANATLKYCKNGQEMLAFLNTSGKSGEILQTPKPDLILLDIQMPGVDGFSLCQYLSSKSNLKDIPIFFLTGLGASTDVQRGIRSGGSYYFVKPVDFQKLFQKISELLEVPFP